MSIKLLTKNDFLKLKRIYNEGKSSILQDPKVFEAFKADLLNISKKDLEILIKNQVKDSLR